MSASGDGRRGRGKQLVVSYRAGGEAVGLALERVGVKISS